MSPLPVGPAPHHDIVVGGRHERTRRITTCRQARDAARSRGASRKVREITGYWWVWLVAGIAWLIVSLVILQFDDASVTTVGVLVGLMFLFASVQNFLLTAVAESLRWLWALFGVLFVVAAVVCFVNPRRRSPGSPTSSASFS